MERQKWGLTDNQISQFSVQIQNANSNVLTHKEIKVSQIFAEQLNKSTEVIFLHPRKV